MGLKVSKDVGRRRIRSATFTVPPRSPAVAPMMIVESSYDGYRIEVTAERIDGTWDAVVRLRRVLTDDKPHVEGVRCRKLTVELAETRATIWARRWVDLNGKY
jgi:hypothetical protein